MAHAKEQGREGYEMQLDKTIARTQIHLGSQRQLHVCNTGAKFQLKQSLGGWGSLVGEKMETCYKSQRMTSMTAKRRKGVRVGGGWVITLKSLKSHCVSNQANERVGGCFPSLCLLCGLPVPTDGLCPSHLPTSPPWLFACFFLLPQPLFSDMALHYFCQVLQVSGNS